MENELQLLTGKETLLELVEKLEEALAKDYKAHLILNVLISIQQKVNKIKVEDNIKFSFLNRLMKVVDANVGICMALTAKSLGIVYMDEIYPYLTRHLILPPLVDTKIVRFTLKRCKKKLCDCQKFNIYEIPRQDLFSILADMEILCFDIDTVKDKLINGYKGYKCLNKYELSDIIVEYLCVSDTIITDGKNKKEDSYLNPDYFINHYNKFELKYTDMFTTHMLLSVDVIRKDGL